MTAEEHYREAERFVALIGDLPSVDDTADATIVIAAASALAARAQVHATLALVGSVR